jgi:hypothetical protein
MTTNDDSVLDDSTNNGPGEAADDGLDEVPDLDERMVDAPAAEPPDLSDPDLAGELDPDQTLEPESVLPEDE